MRTLRTLLLAGAWLGAAHIAAAQTGGPAPSTPPDDVELVPLVPPEPQPTEDEQRAETLSKYALEPLQARVKPGGTVELRVVSPGIEQVVWAVQWSVNGIEGGTPASGTVKGTVRDAGRTAVYRAPAKAGKVTVTATFRPQKDTGAKQLQVLAEIEVVEDAAYTLEDCAEDLTRVVAEREAIRDDTTRCLDAIGEDPSGQKRIACQTRFNPLLDAKDAEYERIDAQCTALGEQINRGALRNR